MHDIERKPDQDDATVKITDLPRQPFARRSLVAGAVVLLVLVVIFSVVLLRGQSSSRPGPGRAPTQMQPTSQATPVSSADGSSQMVFITIANDIAYAGSTAAVYALHTNNGTLLWRSKIEGSVGDQPVVANGVVYVIASTNITATLYALRESDGTQLWHRTSNGPGISTPIVANGVVYVGTQEDKVLALQAASGTILWQYSDSEFGLLWPHLVDGVVYVTANDEQPGNVYALRANDGRLLWHYRASASLNGITLIDGVAYVTGRDGTLTALRSSDGLRLWQRALGGSNIATLWQPIQALNGVLYVATTKMSAPTASTSRPGLLPQALSIGSLLWGNIQAVPARQMMPHKEGVSALFAIRASDGAMLWHFTMNNGKNGVIGWLTLADGVIYTNVMDFSTSNTSGDHIYALQSTTGSVLWRHDDTRASSPSGAMLANGVIYVIAYTQDRNDVVYALRASDGSMLWHQAMGHTVYNAPIINGATVYVGTGDGSVYALRASNGAIAWHHGA
jgi:outer membrane protein assembly factor BamB